jgi:hypothetical protein
MDELEALNMLLRLIGSSPVNSLDTDHPDAANARATLTRVSRRIQRRGWWCNIDYNVTFSPDNTGQIKVPDTVSSFVAEDHHLVPRGNKLYNKLTNTYTFSSNVTARRIVRVLEWDEMPPLMQDYCAYFAGAEFVRDEIEDANKEASLQRSAASSLLDLKKQELEEGQYNIFSKSRVVQARAGTRPYSRGSVRFFNDPDV